MSRNRLVVVSLVILMSLPVVFGQSTGNAFAGIYKDLESFVKATISSPAAADFLIYALTLVSMFLISLKVGPWKEHANSNAGKTIAITLGVGCSISIVAFEIANDWFFVRDLGPVAFAIMFLFIGFLLYKHFESNRVIAGLLLLMGWFIAFVQIPGLGNWVNSLPVGAFVSLAWLIIALVMIFGGMFPKGNASTTTTTPPSASTSSAASTPPSPANIKSLIAQFHAALPNFVTAAGSYHTYFTGLPARTYLMPPIGSPGSLTITEIANLNSIASSISPQLTTLSSLIASIRPNLGILPAGDPDLATYTADETTFNTTYAQYTVDLTQVAGSV